MGNNLSNPERHLLASAATSLISSSTLPDADALRRSMAGLLQSESLVHVQPANSLPRGSKKQQCRWCIETFDRKFNKDRHEARKHPVELAAAANASAVEAAGAAPARVVDNRKRPATEELSLADDREGFPNSSSSVTNTESNPRSDQLEPELKENPFKRARVMESDSPSDFTAAAITAATVAMHDVEQPGAASSVMEDSVHEEVAQLEEDLDQLHEALQSGNLFPESMRKDLEATDAQISFYCTPFLSWLCSPAVTETERIVKARRVDPKQLAPIKKNLAFIIKTVLGTRMIEPHHLRLEVFTQETLCQQFNTFLDERKVGASRIYALFLLIKKILVFLASSESARRREYIAPTTWNSWTCVDSICSDSNTRRKQLSQNRKLLGAEQCKSLAQGPSRVTPTADDLKMPALFGEQKKAKSASVQVFRLVPSSTTQQTASTIRKPDANELKPEELKKITQGCVEYLRNSTATVRTDYVAFLLTATLCLAMAPRQQVLRQLQLGSSFVKKADGRYWILMLASMNKNGKATTFPIAQELTQAYDFYFETVRPALMGLKSHAFVFCKRTGDAPGETFDFSDWTRSVSKTIIGRPVNCHAFRSAFVTAYYQTGANQNEMNALADV